MRIYHTPTGVIADRVMAAHLPVYDTSRLANPTLYIDVDEAVNMPLTADLIAYGLAGKYEIDPITQELLEVEGWEPMILE